MANLRRSLQSLGSNLIIRQGEPETVIPQFVEDLNIFAVLFHGEVTSEAEILIDSAVDLVRFKVIS